MGWFGDFCVPLVYQRKIFRGSARAHRCIFAFELVVSQIKEVGARSPNCGFIPGCGKGNSNAEQPQLRLRSTERTISGGGTTWIYFLFNAARASAYRSSLGNNDFLRFSAPRNRPLTNAPFGFT